ncbi:MAG: hypothetical protein II943_00710 [Victivallales bacterium]|nr:hypothetical protein [Victivallales bacterium]
MHKKVRITDAEKKKLMRLHGVKSARSLIAGMLMKIAKSVLAKRYIVMYDGKDGDCYKVWVEANNPSDAEDEAMREYWDIKEIISVWEDR